MTYSFVLCHLITDLKCSSVPNMEKIFSRTQEKLCKMLSSSCMAGLVKGWNQFTVLYKWSLVNLNTVVNSYIKLLAKFATSEIRQAFLVFWIFIHYIWCFIVIKFYSFYILSLLGSTVFFCCYVCFALLLYSFIVLCSLSKKFMDLLHCYKVILLAVFAIIHNQY